jgi:hypothetical protein
VNSAVAVLVSFAFVFARVAIAIAPFDPFDCAVLYFLMDGHPTGVRPTSDSGRPNTASDEHSLIVSRLATTNTV